MKLAGGSWVEVFTEM